MYISRKNLGFDKFLLILVYFFIIFVYFWSEYKIVVCIFVYVNSFDYFVIDDGSVCW